MSKDYKEAIGLLESFKKNYDRYASFRIKVRDNAPHFLSLDQLKTHWSCCSDRPSADVEVAAYPFVNSEKFARLLHVRCNCCGMTFVPHLDFELDDYYEKDYQQDVQPFRMHTGKFYEPSNPFLSSPTYSRMLRRARIHLRYLEDGPEKSILDIGCGVGILLKEAKAGTKYADEPDPYSKKILKSELGVKLTRLDKLKNAVDGVVASHIVEHLFIGKVPEFFNSVHRALKTGGRFVVEVPDGADQINRLKQGERGGVLFEPHTISFSAYSLIKLLKQAGFTIQTVHPGESFASLPDDMKAEISADTEIKNETGILVVARKL
ncbi:class I SAM-dependent methyltransferase [Rhodobacteraceae bacterium RKSG542]|uniref:class I SAM-dependent methyltransferase n=1 Tax=Pseudovibrio flavus TaxID=2529854 RepID=UPI0012BCBEF2|nr:class I SAM-dependent methyltransferase [Pseudovibrio flavus]MTI17302.1 class I SAM-dependent methyltransferase [Pseudovibrio flavus]